MVVLFQRLRNLAFHAYGAAPFKVINGGFRILIIPRHPDPDPVHPPVGVAGQFTVVDPERIIDARQFFDLLPAEESRRDKFLAADKLDKFFLSPVPVIFERNDLVRKVVSGQLPLQNNRIMAVIAEGRGCNGIRNDLRPAAGAGINNRFPAAMVERRTRRTRFFASESGGSVRLFSRPDRILLFSGSRLRAVLFRRLLIVKRVFPVSRLIR